MKTLLATRYVSIPEDVTLDVKSRVVTVTGPRGELVQSFKHVNLDLQKTGNKLRVDLWFGTRKQVRAEFVWLFDHSACVPSWRLGFLDCSVFFSPLEKCTQLAVMHLICGCVVSRERGKDSLAAVVGAGENSGSFCVGYPRLCPLLCSRRLVPYETLIFSGDSLMPGFRGV